MAVEASAITDMVHSSANLQCLNKMIFYYYRGVEQLAARRAHNPEVAGSSPAPAITMTVNASASTDMVHSSKNSQCLI